LAAYLAIAERLDTAPNGIDEAWNIGPDSADTRPVLEVARAMAIALGAGEPVLATGEKGPHEATLLTLDCAKARIKLGWRPRLAFEDCMRWTAAWYAAWHKGEDITEFTRGQIEQFNKLAA